MDDGKQQVRDAVLEAAEAVLEAQLRAVRSLRRVAKDAKPAPENKRIRGMSHVDMAYDILRNSEPLHVAVLIERMYERFGVRVDRESLVSALSKRVARLDRFRRVARNTFSVIEGIEAEGARE
jgi:hypothetical protein